LIYELVKVTTGFRWSFEDFKDLSLDH